MTAPDEADRPVPGDAPSSSGRHDAWRDATALARRRAAADGYALTRREFGAGGVVLVPAGRFGPEGRRELERARHDLAAAGVTDVVVDLGELAGCDDHLVRVLTHLRMRLLVAGMRVEWCRVPSRLAPEIRAGVAETFRPPPETPMREKESP